jgi:hypothetical protein
LRTCLLEPTIGESLFRTERRPSTNGEQERKGKGRDDAQGGEGESERADDQTEIDGEGDGMWGDVSDAGAVI